METAAEQLKLNPLLLEQLLQANETNREYKAAITMSMMGLKLHQAFYSDGEEITTELQNRLGDFFLSQGSEWLDVAKKSEVELPNCLSWMAKQVNLGIKLLGVGFFADMIGFKDLKKYNNYEYAHMVSNTLFVLLIEAYNGNIEQLLSEMNEHNRKKAVVHLQSLKATCMIQRGGFFFK